MGRSVFITGTDTDVGKSTFSAALCYALSKSGSKVGYFKPALSGALRQSDNSLMGGDVELARNAASLSDPEQAVASYLFEEAVSPHLAARTEGVLIEPSKILMDHADMARNCDLVIVEGAGGAACPLVAPPQGPLYTISDLMLEMKLPGVIVCRAKLGTLHHTAATVAYLRQYDIPLLGILVNGYEDDAVCRDNLLMLEQMTELPILAVFPKLSDGECIEEIRAAVDLHWDEFELIRRLFP